MDDDDKFMRTL